MTCVDVISDFETMQRAAPTMDCLQNRKVVCDYADDLQVLSVPEPGQARRGR